ncbi:Uma2 family endonuclease [Bernardetia sp. OM2101]|uniref:Uma2 family endonuclease n=1 Tax=Bernardetia sp. OM2101 TaxID=3344876 RepID=UPI0035D11A53
MGISKRKISVEEYMMIDANTDEKIEYLNGEIRAMAGTTLEHQTIILNLVELLRSCLKKKGCRLVTGDMKLHTPDCEKAFLYPDIHIYCGEIEKEKMLYGAYSLKEPKIIIEVLSAFTSNYDKADKFECYKKIKSLEKYIMIESSLDTKEPAVYVRTLESETKYTEEMLNIDAILEILGCEVSVKDIYEM